MGNEYTIPANQRGSFFSYGKFHHVGEDVGIGFVCYLIEIFCVKQRYGNFFPSIRKSIEGKTKRIGILARKRK